MIAVVMIVRNEVDVIRLSLLHLFYEGVDRVYVYDGRSTDGTRDIYDELIADRYDLTVYDDNSEFCEQAALTNELIARAGARGATWIVPSDADEFPYATDGRTIAEVLFECDHDKLFMRSWQHRDWNMRHQSHKRLPKCAFRYQPSIQVTFGNHDTNTLGGVYDVLDMRELQYRGLNHFLAKTAERNARLSPHDRAYGYGAHHSARASLTPEQMEQEWQRELQIPVTFDPIPSRLPQSLSRTMEALT